MNTRFDYDIVFCQLPPMGLDRIYSAPPILKGVVQSAGYRSRCYDFNLTFFEFCNRDLEVFGKLQNYFILESMELTESEQEIINKYTDYILKIMIGANSRYIGLSVFSFYTQKITLQLLIKFQEHGLKDRIVLGGRGLSTPCGSGVIKLLNLSEDENKLDFFEILKNRNLVTHTIIGDGEDAVVEFLNHDAIGVDNHELTEMPHHWPDYQDYNFDNYLWVNDIPALEITGSSGCVRNCDFCDVRKHFGRYKFLPGSELADQMIQLQAAHGINKFILTDSLSNGGLKHFKEFVLRLSDHNSTATVPIIWTGTYICRDMSNHKDIDEYYRLIKLSGAQGLTIGAESGSNYVLEAIDKKSTVEALFFELEYFRKYNITCQLLTFIGHWSERHEDFIAQCKMLIDLIPYIRSGHISGMHLGFCYKILNGSPSSRDINIIKTHNPDMWIARTNRGNTFKVRCQRRLISSKLAHAMQMGILLEESNKLQTHNETIKSSYQEFNDFFSKYTNDTSQFDSIEDVDKFVNEMLNYKKTFDVKLTVESNTCNGDPNIIIRVNNNILWQGELVHGKHNLELSVDNSMLSTTSNVFSIELTNKEPLDTEIDKQGNIVKDKNIQLKSLKINNCDLINDIDFFYNNFYSLDTNGDQIPVGTGIWSNGSLNLNFELPFVQWYSANSSSNKINDQADRSQQQVNGLYSVEEYFDILSCSIKKLVI